MLPLVRLLDGQGTVVIRSSEATDGVGCDERDLTEKPRTLQERNGRVTLVAVTEQTETIQRAFEAFNDRELEAFLAFCHRDVEWDPPVELPESRTHHGREGVREALDELLTVF